MRKWRKNEDMERERKWRVSNTDGWTYQSTDICNAYYASKKYLKFRKSIKYVCIISRPRNHTGLQGDLVQL